MNKIDALFTVRTLTAAVKGALLLAAALPLVGTARADDAEVKALTQPTSTVEIGAANVSTASAKAGEYDGLDKSGAYLIGNFRLRGGDAYAGGNGLRRWQLDGVDLGTTSRELAASVGDQSRWNLGFRYDELRHHITDSYQTPYRGNNGDNTFLLLPDFGVIDANPDLPSGQGLGTQGLTATQLAAFHKLDLYTQRRNTSFNAGYLFSRAWSVSFAYNRLEQSGAKPIALGSDAGGGAAVENIVVLPNPTHFTTDTFELGAAWVGESAHVDVSYYASLFKDANSNFTWSNPFIDTNGGPSGGIPPAPFPLSTFATPPESRFQQVNVNGGLDLDDRTKLAGGLSYGRTTQDSAFIADPLTVAMPQSSLNGRVVTTHADLRLTHQTTRALTLSAGLKYNQRDDRSPTLVVPQLDSIAGDTYYNVTTAPESDKKTQLEFAGNYRVDKAQSVRVAYEYELVKRWCNNAASNSALSEAIANPVSLSPVAAFNASYRTGACVETPESRENKLSATYKVRLSPAVRFGAGYSYGKRAADLNAAFYSPIQTNPEGIQNTGFRAWFDGPRREQIFKANLDWTVGSRWNFDVGGRVVDDKFNADLGVQKNQKWSLNFDATYAYVDGGTASVYASTQRRTRDLASADSAQFATPTNFWSNRLRDQSDTFGLTARNKELYHGRVELLADLSYSHARTRYSTEVAPSYVLAAPDDCTSGVSCGELPAITNRAVRLKLTGSYALDPASKVSVGYIYKKLDTSDYFYTAYQTGLAGPAVLPTNQQPPSHSVSVLGVSYLYSFQ
jgi:MtrB/PioB family decaheme-associated outer membrane protein